LFANGLEIVQLRLKTRPESRPDVEIPAAVGAARENGGRLLVNGHWRLALTFGAHGVHLGEADWNGADLPALRRAGLILGLSVHSPAQIARALTLNPDYLTLGTVFPTPSKPSQATTLGLAGFAALRPLIPLPTVAIGGLCAENFAPLLAAGADAIGVISDLRAAGDLGRRVDEWRRQFLAARAPR
jgi:thiamine-phosphate pyrophosphorylase